MVSPRPLRVAFFGTPEFAIPTLEKLLASVHPVVAVVSQPDRPRGRGQRLQATPTKALAARHSIPVTQPDRLKDDAFVNWFERLEPDSAVVAAYGKILPQRVLEIPRLGFLNVHASLLPRYRGAAPVARAIMAGETETGITIMRVVPELDAGPMLASARRPVGPDETTVDVERVLAVLGADLLADVLDRLEDGVREIPQDEAGATYAAPVGRDEGLIDWSRPARDIHNQVRALHPWPHAWSFVEGTRLIVLRTALTGTPATGDAASGAPPGTLVTAEGDTLRVKTGEGDLDLVEVQVEGRNPVTSRASMAGHRLRAGTVLKPAP
jgi:methionyl-tRNA formyltransferase